MQVFFFKASLQAQSHLFLGLAPFNTSTNIAIQKNDFSYKISSQLKLIYKLKHKYAN